MTEKRELPSIAGDLTPPQPKRKLDLKAIQPSAALDDTTVAANSIALGQKWGAMTSLAEEGQSRPVTDGAPKPRQRRPLATEKLQIEVPDYLGAELAARAGAERVTKQFLVLQGLKAIGFHVEDSDLVTDRRRGRKG